MRKVPEANASWHGDFIRQYHDVNVSVAVQTPAGLQVPVLRGADRLGLTDISSGVKDIATKVRRSARHLAGPPLHTLNPALQSFTMHVGRCQSPCLHWSPATAPCGHTLCIQTRLYVICSTCEATL